MQRQVALNNDSFERAGITKDCKDAVCEYIWNGFEAGASKVSVSMTGSPLKQAMSLKRVKQLNQNLQKIRLKKLNLKKNHASLRKLMFLSLKG